MMSVRGDGHDRDRAILSSGVGTGKKRLMT
jgi:hypothetical protein